MQIDPNNLYRSARQNLDQLAHSLTPLANQAAHMIEAGAALPGVLREAILTSFLVGRGMTQAAASSLVQGWRQATGMPTPPGADLVSRIETEMKDEASAAAFYGELINATDNEVVKDYVRHAMEDEQKHYRMLRQLHQELTGRTYDAQPVATPFNDICEGLKKAMDNEYDAFEEYRTNYLQQHGRNVRNVFFELMTDELEHATRFNYALQLLCR